MPNDADRAETPAGVFGAELRYFRTRAGLSQKDLAPRVNVSHDVISKIETARLTSTVTRCWQQVNWIPTSQVSASLQMAVAHTVAMSILLGAGTASPSNGGASRLRSSRSGWRTSASASGT